MNTPSYSAGLLVVGVVCLLAAVALPVVWPTYGQTPYYISPVAVDQSDVEADANKIQYDELPPAAQEAFDHPASDRSQPLYSERDREAIQLLGEGTYIEHEGQLYEAFLEHGDGAWLYVMLFRYGVGAVGGLLMMVGIGAVGYNRIRPSETDDS